MSARYDYSELGFMADADVGSVRSKVEQRRYLEAAKAIAEIDRLRAELAASRVVSGAFPVGSGVASTDAQTTRIVNIEAQS